MIDPYLTLGVSKTATADEIKRAYRSMSMKHHPDRGGDAEQFKKINEAYQILSDPQKRAEYDNPRSEFRFHSGPDFNDVFNDFFKQRSRTHNSLLRVTLHIDLKTAVTGGARLVSLATAHGHEALEVEIPQGTSDGDTIRYPSIIQNNDLIVTYRILPDKIWTVQGLNLTKNYELDFWDLILGTKITVDTIQGEKISISVPPKTQPGTLLRIKGKGIQSKRYTLGDMFVRITARIPENLPAELIEDIKRLRN